MKETQDIQNILARLEKEVYEKYPNADIKIRKQYHKAVRSLSDAKHEFDIFNQMIDSVF